MPYLRRTGQQVQEDRLGINGLWSPKNNVIPAKAGIQQGTEIETRYSYVYILASKRFGTLYVGVTADLAARVKQHKKDVNDGFTRKYQVHTLVYYQQFENIEDAILVEKRIKGWKRDWKIRLIEENNPTWRDLYSDFS